MKSKTLHNIFGTIFVYLLMWPISYTVALGDELCEKLA